MKLRSAVSLLILPMVIAGCAAAPPTPADDGIEAEEVLRVTTPHAESGGTLLEGPTFGEDGDLYVVDVMAPQGAPKVLRIDLDTKDVSTIYTDQSSAFTSAQFSPVDGLLYLTDIQTGSIVRMSANGDDVQTVFSGPVNGQAMLPDDLTFDGDGNLFISDTNGMRSPGWETPGRVVRVDREGSASVLADNLPSPNGIALDENDQGLWVAQYNANRVDYYELNDAHDSIVAAHPGIYVDAGRSRVDSTAVDTEGNIYQAFHGKAEIAVYSPDGARLKTVSFPGSDLLSATNIALTPGTRKAYATVTGTEGGYIYAFDALADGGRHSNGG